LGSSQRNNKRKNEMKKQIQHLESPVYELQEALQEVVKPKPKAKAKSKV
jgi:hypothetical protein